MNRAAMLLLCLMAVAFPLTKMYDVVPFRNCIGTQSQGALGVSQYVRNTLDSLSRVSVWVCDSDTHRYLVEILDSVQPTVRIADGYGATPAGFAAG